jgi:hypothetical protein
MVVSPPERTPHSNVVETLKVTSCVGGFIMYVGATSMRLIRTWRSRTSVT